MYPEKHPITPTRHKRKEGLIYQVYGKKRSDGRNTHNNLNVWVGLSNLWTGVTRRFRVVRKGVSGGQGDSTGYPLTPGRDSCRRGGVETTCRVRTVDPMLSLLRMSLQYPNQYPSLNYVVRGSQEIGCYGIVPRTVYSEIIYKWFNSCSPLFILL